MSFYQYHVFFCTNKRAPGEQACENHGAAALRGYAKQRVKALGDKVSGNVRVNAAGCLGRCERGPTIVIYPEGTWYTYVDQEDIDEIIDSHLMQGKVVERLLVDK